MHEFNLIFTYCGVIVRNTYIKRSLVKKKARYFRPMCCRIKNLSNQETQGNLRTQLGEVLKRQLRSALQVNSKVLSVFALPRIAGT